MAQQNNRRGRTTIAQEEAESVLDQAKDRAQDLKENLQEHWEQAGKAAREKAKQVHHYAEENPWQMTAAGVVAGFILGALIFRRRD